MYRGVTPLTKNFKHTQNECLQLCSSRTSGNSTVRTSGRGYPCGFWGYPSEIPEIPRLVLRQARQTNTKKTHHKYTKKSNVSMKNKKPIQNDTTNQHTHTHTHTHTQFKSNKLSVSQSVSQSQQATKQQANGKPGWS